MGEEREKYKVVVKLKKIRANSLVNHNDKIVILINFFGWDP